MVTRMAVEMTDKDQQSFKNLSGRSKPHEVSGNRIDVSDLVMPPIDSEVCALMAFVQKAGAGYNYYLILRRLLYERERIGRELTKALTVVKIARHVKTDEGLNRAVHMHDHGAG